MADERVQRRLTIILSVDVEGYSRLMSTDEEATLRVLDFYCVIIENLISDHGGRIFNTAGDSVLAKFASAVEAVRCAVLCQERIAGCNEGLAEDRILIFRMGVNLGDVKVRDDDLFGDGVNLAARLEGICGPGEVYVSGGLHDQVEGKLGLSFDDLGEQIVKNIARPVRAYRVVGSSEAPAQSGLEETPSLPAKLSVAVLPFGKFSGDPEQENFSDGNFENIITEISKISGLFVIARHSSFI